MSRNAYNIQVVNTNSSCFLLTFLFQIQTLDRSEVRWTWNKSLNVSQLPFPHLKMELVMSPTSQGHWGDLNISNTASIRFSG